MSMTTRKRSSHEAASPELRTARPTREPIRDMFNLQSAASPWWTLEHARWASKKRQGASSTRLRELLIHQQGRCALSGVSLLFNVHEGTPLAGERGSHPLYPAVDHIDPGNPDGGHQIVCYALNDLKGHLPVDCFNDLVKTAAWHRLMLAWRQLASTPHATREDFYKLLRPNARTRGTLKANAG